MYSVTGFFIFNDADGYTVSWPYCLMAVMPGYKHAAMRALRKTFYTETREEDTKTREGYVLCVTRCLLCAALCNQKGLLKVAPTVKP